MSKQDQELDYKAIGQQAYESGYTTGYMDGAIKAHEAKQEQRSVSEQLGEPVAYRSRMRNRDGQVITGWVVHLETTENPDPRVEIEPLYTTPQPAQKPLTDEQIDELAEDCCFLGNIYEIVAAIEAAHGIKENT